MVDSDTFNVTVTPQAKADDAYVVAGVDVPFRYFDMKSYDNTKKLSLRSDYQLRLRNSFWRTISVIMDV